MKKAPSVKTAARTSMAARQNSMYTKSVDRPRKDRFSSSDEYFELDGSNRCERARSGGGWWLT